jgi:hypothetical protein
MPLSGRIAVDVEFTDSTTSGVTQNLKRVALKYANEYTTGQVAIVSGTCGTSNTSISLSSPGFKNSQGSPVSFSSILRFAFSATPVAQLSNSIGGVVAYSRDGNLAIGNPAVTSQGYIIKTVGTVATASYTLVLYGT